MNIPIKAQREHVFVDLYPKSAMATGGLEGDPELQRFMEMESQKAKFQANVHTFTDLCWDKCMPDKLGSRMDSKAEQCISNCVNRFIDVTEFVVNRLGNKNM